jgi:DNA-binding response OmpR family regulator
MPQLIEENNEMTEESSTEKPLALVIEDNEIILEIIKVALQQAEFEVESFEDGCLALERLAVITPALIVLDFHLPHITGKQIVEAIRAEERLAKVWMILATADLPKAASLAYEVNFILAKPFSFFDLHDLARQLRSCDVPADQGQNHPAKIISRTSEVYGYFS